MSKSLQAKINYGQRRDMRIRRDKTAALLMPYCLSQANGVHDDQWKLHAAQRAIEFTDILLAELDRTRPRETNGEPE